MAQKDMFRYVYEFFGTTIEISSNSTEWLHSVSNYLALKPQQAVSEPDIRLSLFEAGPDELDAGLIPPFPGQQYLVNEFDLLLDRDIKSFSYSLDEQQWTDFTGYGRQWVNLSQGISLAARYPNSNVDPLYSDILFGFNALVNLLWKRGFYSVHASCVDVDGKGVLFTGHSGQGKSTSALAMLVSGCPILADDRVLVSLYEGNYYAASLSDVIKLSQDSVERFFPQLQSINKYRELLGEIYIKVGQAGNSLQFVPSVPINRVVVLQKTGLPESRYERINPARVVGDLFPVTLNISDPIIMQDKFSFLMDFLGHIPCYRVYSGTDMQLFAGTIRDLVKENV